MSAWVVERKGHIELFFLPIYAPELNPDEYLNGDLKTNTDRPARNQQEQEERVLSVPELYPQKMRAYFRHPCIAYAA